MTTPDPQHLQPGAAPKTGGTFRRWRRSRPFWGGLFTLLSGLEIFATTQMNPMAVSVHLGPPGFLSWLIPTILVTCGLLLWSSPQQRSFYAIIATLTAVASFIYVNLGGFFLGILLGMIGGALGFAWTPAGPRPPEVVPVPNEDEEVARFEHVPVDELLDEPGHHRAVEPAEPAESAPAADAPAADAPGEQPLPAAAGHPDLLTDTLPQPRNPLREPAEPARATVTDATVTDAEGPTDGVRSADEDETPPSPGGPLPRRSPRLFVVTLLAISLTAAGSVVIDQGYPADAAPCRTTVRPAPSAARPVPTRTPASPAPSVTATPTPTPTPTPTASSSAGSTETGGNLITTVVDGVRSLFGDGQAQEAVPAAPTPTATAVGPAAVAPAPARVAATPSATSPADKPAAVVPCATSKPTTPKPGQSASSAVVPKLAADPAQPTAANTPSRLTGTKLTMTNLTYEGVVSDFHTAAGPLPVLKFSMTKAVTDDFALQVPGEPGRSLLYKSPQLTVEGHVDFYTTRFVGWILGVKLTLTPDSPLPPDGIDLSAPVPVTFTDPDIQLALIGCDTLAARPTLTQTLV